MHRNRLPVSGSIVVVLIATLFAVALLTGCSRVALTIWTDTPEVATIVETYNASQDRHVAELRYEPDVSRALRLATTPPDIVIARYIEDAATARLLSPLDRLLGRAIAREQFYAPLLAAGVRDGRQVLLPLSFNLPLVYFASTVRPLDEPMIIDPAEMRMTGSEVNRMASDRWDRLAYSPIWEAEFLYQYARAGGFRIAERADSTPGWSFESLQAFLREAADWVGEINGGVGADRLFQERYLYAPILQLVREGRVWYGYDRSDRFFTMSDSRRAGLRFRWLGTDESVRVLEDVVYVGIPQRAASRRAAENLVSWLFQVDRQEAILSSAMRKRINSFGIAGGFSSLWQLNERILPRYYPELAGRVPPAAWLTFPPPSPDHLGELVPEVVVPWLLRELTGVPQGRDLESAVRAWLLQQE